MPLMTAFVRQRQTDVCEFKASLGSVKEGTDLEFIGQPS